MWERYNQICISSHYCGIVLLCFARSNKTHQSNKAYSNFRLKKTNLKSVCQNFDFCSRQVKKENDRLSMFFHGDMVIHGMMVPLGKIGPHWTQITPKCECHWPTDGHHTNHNFIKAFFFHSKLAIIYQNGCTCQTSQLTLDSTQTATVRWVRKCEKFILSEEQFRFQR